MNLALYIVINRDSAKRKLIAHGCDFSHEITAFERLQLNYDIREKFRKIPSNTNQELKKKIKITELVNCFRTSIIEE